MWSPFEIHNERAKASGIREALIASMMEHPHHLLVSQGVPDSLLIEDASELVATFESCPVSYVGARHGKPMAPFCAFVVDAHPGQLRLEYLIDYGVPSDIKVENNWLSNAVLSILAILFYQNPQVQQVLLPLSLKAQAFVDFETKEIGGKCVATRAAAGLTV